MRDIPHIRLRLVAGAAFAVWFWIVYFGCDYLARGFEHRYSVATGLDAALPFLPQFANAYMGVNLMLLLPLVIIRDTARVLALAAAMATEVAVAGIVYMVYPVEASMTPAGHGSAMLGMADAVNLTYNSFPSLHVALTVSSAIAMSRDLRPLPRALLWLAAAAIVASTILTRQHFVADAFAGLVLALLAMAFLFPPLARSAASRLRQVP